MTRSARPLEVANQAHTYVAEIGPDNVAQLHASLSDTLLLTGIGFEPPPAIAVLP